MSAALRVEWLKLRRSRVALVATALMGVLLPAMGLAFYDVAVSGGVGSVADKAAALLTGEGWIGYLGLVDQIAAVAVFLGAGVVVAWVFGREHVDRTFSSLFALTVSRGTIAGAKFIVLTVWVVALAFLIALVAFVYGVLAGIAPIDPGVVFPELIRLLAIAAGSGALSLTMGYVASSGRGYLPAIGSLIVIIAAAQVAVLFGTGGWFPFAVPGLAAIAGAEGAPDLTPLQVALVPALAALTTLLTIRWWTRTEATRS
jgi:ABC-2 type transport system permease protein